MKYASGQLRWIEKQIRTYFFDDLDFNFQLCIVFSSVSFQVWRRKTIWAKGFSNKSVARCLLRIPSDFFKCNFLLAFDGLFLLLLQTQWDSTWWTRPPHRRCSRWCTRRWRTAAAAAGIRPFPRTGTKPRPAISVWAGSPVTCTVSTPIPFRLVFSEVCYNFFWPLDILMAIFLLIFRALWCTQMRTMWRGCTRSSGVPRALRMTVGSSSFSYVVHRTTPFPVPESNCSPRAAAKSASIPTSTPMEKCALVFSGKEHGLFCITFSFKEKNYSRYRQFSERFFGKSIIRMENPSTHAYRFHFDQYNHVENHFVCSRTVVIKDKQFVTGLFTRRSKVFISRSIDAVF